MNRNDAVQVVFSRAEYLAILDALERPVLTYGGRELWKDDRFISTAQTRAYPTLHADDLASAIDKLERADRPTLRPVA